MKPVVFENEDGSQKVTFTITRIDDDSGNDTNVKIDFDPPFGEQDSSSLHMAMATTFMA